MKILYLTVSKFDNIDSHGIYADLLRFKAKHGDDVYIVSPIEKKYNGKTRLVEYKADDWHRNVHILIVKTGNIQKTGFLEKGISMILFERQVLCSIKKYFKNIIFDLVLYSTPPVTLVKPISFLKKKHKAKTYLMLKDIFPQNALDLGILKKDGLKGFIYRFFRKKEIKLYKLSDKIGCMSDANVGYMLKNNGFLTKENVEVFPNCIEPNVISLTSEQRTEIRLKYNIPLDKKVFVYGGNLGKPQGIDFIIDCIRVTNSIDNAFFLIAGDGTDFTKLKAFCDSENPTNFRLMQWIPKEDYEMMIASCDVGLIFLDFRFTIPNFPSRLLSYMQANLPVLASTDESTDIGKVIVDGGFGWWCKSNDPDSFAFLIRKILKTDLAKYKEKSKQYLISNYSIESNVNKIK